MACDQCLKNILILSSAETDKKLSIHKDWVCRLNHLADDVLFDWVNYRNISFEFINSEARVANLTANKDLSAYDLVFIKSYFRSERQASAIYDYLLNHETPSTGTELIGSVASDKLAQAMKLALANISMPDTICYFTSEYWLSRYDHIIDQLGSPFIFKDINGTTGNNNFLVSSLNQLKTILLDHSNVSFMAQKFIPNAGDLRIVVMGGRISMVIRRQRRDDSTHLNNTSQGASSELVPVDSLSAEIRQMAMSAAQATGRDIAGVDVIVDKQTSKSYILEINASPQLGSGAFVDEKLEMVDSYCRRRLNEK